MPVKDSDGKEIKLSNYGKGVFQRKNKCIKHSLHILCALKFSKRKMGKHSGLYFSMHEYVFSEL